MYGYAGMVPSSPRANRVVTCRAPVKVFDLGSNAPIIVAGAGPDSLTRAMIGNLAFVSPYAPMSGTPDRDDKGLAK